MQRRRCLKITAGGVPKNLSWPSTASSTQSIGRIDMDLQSTIEIHFKLPLVYVLLVLNVVFGGWASFNREANQKDFFPFGFFCIEGLVLLVNTIVWIIETTRP